MAKFACCVPHCRNYKGKAPSGTAWHAFPKNEIYRAAWIARIAQEVGQFHKTKHSRVCSNHFVESDYRPHLHTKLKLLKRIAVPSVFLWRNGTSADKQPTEKDIVPMDKSDNAMMAVISTTTAPHHHNNNNNNNNNSHHYADQHAVVMSSVYEPPVTPLNGHCVGYESEPVVAYPHMDPDDAASPASDTYELTELTPMIKPEPRSVTPQNEYIEYPPRSRPTKDQQQHVDNGAGQHFISSSCWDEMIRKTVISETFLFTMLRLIKCPQCGVEANPEQMHKYENQGCLLGVRLMCYHGHLVIDWRL